MTSFGTGFATVGEAGGAFTAFDFRPPGVAAIC
jgi:hypothetical protein